MQSYLHALSTILREGEFSADRTGVGTLRLFGMQQRYNLREGFPAITTKKLAFRAVAGELLWFIEGSTDERRLAEITYGTRDEGVKTIWTGNAQAPYWEPKATFAGDVGKGYGHQWRNWGPRIGPPVDQLTNLITGIKADPFSRRHMVVSYNPGEVDEQALPPCHAMFQMSVNTKKELSCHMYQRSADFFLGVPFNVASYALLTHMVAQVCGLGVGDFIHSFGDAHIYRNHVDQVTEQLSRPPYSLPTLELNPYITDISQFTIDDIALKGYQCHPPIAAQMAV